MEIYLDFFFFTNFTADFIILFFIKQDLFPKISTKRIWFGAMISTVVFITGYIIQKMDIAGIGLIVILLSVSITLLWTFQIKTVDAFLKATGLMVLYTFLFGGSCLFFMSRGNTGEFSCEVRWLLEESVLICSGIVTLCWKKRKKINKLQKNGEFEVTIWRNSKKISCQGFYDSGNLLVHSASGKGILVISSEKAKDLLDLEEEQLLTAFESGKEFPWKEMTRKMVHGWWEISYTSLGNRRDKMPAISTERILVKKEEEVFADTKRVVAISKERISKNKEFSVLLPADIFEKENNHGIL